jgi:uncharacterized repeat protein (TIGR01451 family)
MITMKHPLPRIIAVFAFLIFAAGLRAAACVSTACVEIGSRTVAVDNKRSALFNAVSEQLSGAPVNLTPTEWQALANTRITLSQITEQLRATSGNLTDAQLIGTRFTMRELLDAAARAAQANGDSAAAAALSAIPVDSLTGTVSLGELVQGTSAGDASLSALDLTSGLLARYAYDYGVAAPTPSTLTGSQLGLGDSVQSVQFSAIVTEPPVFVCGPAGTQFRSAGMRMKMGIDLADKDLSGALAAQMAANGAALPAGVGAPTASLTQLEFYAVVGRTDGTIAAVDALGQTVTLRARPGVVDLYLGRIDDAVFFNRSRQIRSSDLQFSEIGQMQMDVLGTPVTASVRLKSRASGAPAGYETLYYTGPYPETQTVSPDAFFIENLTNSLIANAELEIVAADSAALDPATRAAFDQAVAAIKPSLNSTYQTALKPVIESLITSVVEPALDFTGTGLGEAELTVTSVHLDCGPGPHARLEPDHEQSASPGTAVFYTHTFTAEVAGTVVFSTSETADPTIAGWSHVLYRDTNANGQIDAGESAIGGTLNVASGERIALVAKVFVPANAAFGARGTLSVRADFTLAGVTGATVETFARTDTTLVGAGGTLGLTLTKQVDKATALPGDTLVYTITYTNQGAAALRDVVIHDATPAYSRFVSAANGMLPASLSSVALSAPAVGESGAVRWNFTGELASGASGSVTFSVRVDP